MSASNADATKLSSEIIKCYHCGMLFSTTESLETHQANFCTAPESRSALNRFPSTRTSPNLHYQYTDRSIHTSPVLGETSISRPKTPKSVSISPVVGINNDSVEIKKRSRDPAGEGETFGNGTNSRNSRYSAKSPSAYNLDPNRAESAIKELKEYKAKKSAEQTLQDLEDTMVRDTIRDKKLATSLSQQQKTPTKNTSSPPTNKPSIPSSKDPLKDLFDQSQNNLKKTGSTETYTSSASSFLSLFEYSDLFDYPELLPPINKDPSNLDALRQGSSTSSSVLVAKKIMLNSDETRQNLERIQAKTIEIEKERREIQYKLEALKHSPAFPLPVDSNESINRILAELRSQQKINEQALSMLKQRLIQSNQATNQNTSDNNNHLNYMNSTQSLRSNILPPIYSSLSNDFMPGYLNNMYDTSLSPEEIRLMRLNYLNNGGHDQHILNKFTEMEYNSRFKNTNITRTTRDTYDPVTLDLENKIRKVDLDNRRLQSEIEMLQEKYDAIADGNASTFDMLRKYNESALPPIRQTPVSQLQMQSQLQPQQLQINPYQQPHQAAPLLPAPSRTKYVPVQETMPNLITHHSQSQRGNYNNNQNNLNEEAPLTYRHEPVNVTPKLIKLKDLSPTPYDPIGGFVIFIDFVTYLDPSYACARVITCLHHPKSGLGEPSVLPIVNCESYTEHGKRVSIALISTKQPVPRCPPQQALTILMELQMAARDSNNETTRLKSCAWSKIPLFDSHNRLLSGRWRSRLRHLPIRADVNVSTVETMPEFGSAELYYRLVNVRDADDQTNAPISPAYADQYTITTQNHSEMQNYDNNENQFKSNSILSNASSQNLDELNFDDGPNNQNGQINDFNSQKKVDKNDQKRVQPPNNQIIKNNANNTNNNTSNNNRVLNGTNAVRIRKNDSINQKQQPNNLDNNRQQKVSNLPVPNNNTIRNKNTKKA